VILQLGTHGPDVVTLQVALAKAGCDPGAADGHFGPHTKAAVMEWQSHAHLPEDGVAGAATLASLGIGQATPAAAPAVPPVTGVAVPADAVTMAEGFEGFRAAPYQDSTGVWTYLFGSTRDPAGNPVTAATPPGDRVLGETLMRRDMMGAANEVAKDVHVALTDNERAALDDLIYNIGQGNFAGSTMLRKLNAGDYAGASLEFDKWDHAGGRVLAGLLRRREAERAEFNRPT
jgi:lysozyme